MILHPVNEEVIFDEIYPVSISAISKTNGETYIVYLHYSVDEGWKLLDIFKDDSPLETIIVKKPEQETYINGIKQEREEFIKNSSNGFIPDTIYPDVDYNAFYQNSDGTWTDPATGYWYSADGYGPFGGRGGAN